MAEASRLVILFGSRARGAATKASDADVAVLADRSLGLEERMALAEELAGQLAVPADAIDLIDLSSAPPLLAREVAETGVLL